MVSLIQSGQLTLKRDLGYNRGLCLYLDNFEGPALDRHNHAIIINNTSYYNFGLIHPREYAMLQKFKEELTDILMFGDNETVMPLLKLLTDLDLSAPA